MPKGHGEDYERKITPHWVGHIVWRKLGLKTERREGGYVIGSGEGSKLERLLEKDGLNSLNSMNFDGDAGTPAGAQDPLIT